MRNGDRGHREQKKRKKKNGDNNNGKKAPRYMRDAPAAPTVEALARERDRDRKRAMRPGAGFI